MISRLSASSGSSNDENMTTFMDRRALMLSLITGVALSGLDSVALAQGMSCIDYGMRPLKSCSDMNLLNVGIDLWKHAIGVSDQP